MASGIPMVSFQTFIKVPTTLSLPRILNFESSCSKCKEKLQTTRRLTSLQKHTELRKEMEYRKPCKTQTPNVLQWFHFLRPQLGGGLVFVKSFSFLPFPSLSFSLLSKLAICPELPNSYKHGLLPGRKRGSSPCWRSHDARESSFTDAQTLHQGRGFELFKISKPEELGLCL